MKFLILFSLSLCFFLACGLHDQKLKRLESKEPAKVAGETNAQLILENAVNSGDLVAIKEAQGLGADLNQRNNEGLPLLMVAIRAEQFAVTEYLVKEKVDLDLLTENPTIDPSQDVREYLEGLAMAPAIKKIFSDIIEQKNLETASLTETLYSSITFKNHFLLKWLFDKGVDPNVVRMSASGRPKDSPLIYLFTLKGVEGEELEKLKGIFDVLVSHPSIDVNLKVKRNTPLKKAKSRLKRNPQYQSMVDRLIELGAH